MFLEAINQILAIWAGEPPYDIEGKYWSISTARTLMADIGQGSCQATAEAASTDRGVGGGTPLQGRDRGGGARLGARSPATF